MGKDQFVKRQKHECFPVGSRLGKLKIISVKKYRSGESYECLCDCGKVKILYGTTLRNGRATSCGCSKLKSIKIGSKFDKLDVLEKCIIENLPKYRCKCECGNECFRFYHELVVKRGGKSCGCSKGVVFSKDRSNVLAKRLFGDLNRRNLKKFQTKASISFDEFKSLIQQNCFYCKISPLNKKKDTLAYKNFIIDSLQYNGIDRICSDISYYIDNTVSCCEGCNKAKRHMPLIDFLQRTKRIVENKEARRFAGLQDFIP